MSDIMDQNYISTEVFENREGSSFDAISEIFGNIYGGGEGTVLTGIANYFNFLVWLLIGFSIGYVLVFYLMNMTNKGQLGGENLVWSGLRTVIAVCFLLPSPFGTSNLSVVQMSIAQVGAVGSNIADNIAIYVNRNTQLKTIQLSSSASGYQTILSMTKNAFCTSAISKNLNGTFSDNSMYAYLNGSHVALNQKLSSSKVVMLGEKGECGRLLVGQSDTAGSEIFSEPLLALNIKYQNRVYDEIVAPLSSYNFETFDSAMTSVVNEGSGELKNAIINASNNFNKIVTQYDTEVNAMILKTLDENNEGESVITYGMTADGQPAMRLSDEYVSRLGWPYLGINHAVLSRAMSKGNESLSIANKPTAEFSDPNGCRTTATGFWDTAKTYVPFTSEDKTCLYNRDFDKSSIVINEASKMMVSSDSAPLAKLSASCTSKENCSADALEANAVNAFKANFAFANPSENGYNKASRAFISALGMEGFNADQMGIKTLDGNLLGGSIEPGALESVDAIAFISQVGHTLVYTSKAVKSVLIFANGISVGITHSGAGLMGGAFVGGVLQPVIDSLFSLTSYMSVAGYSMAYIIPMLPGLFFAMAFISWLLMFAEAIFMAPFIAFNMIVPEGKGIAGMNGQKNLAIVYQLLFRPSMIVVGFLLSISITNICFPYLNQMFWSATGGMSSWSDPLKAFAHTMFWASTMIFYFHACFKIIHSFAESCDAWFNTRMISFGNNFDNDISSKMTSGSGEMAGAMNTSAGRKGVEMGEKLKNQAGREKR